MSVVSGEGPQWIDDRLRPGLELVFEAHGRLGPQVAIGSIPAGEARVIDVESGPFSGPRIRGELFGGGADWQVTRPDGVTQVDAQYGLRTHDGVVIRCRNRGLRHGPPEVMQQLAAGADVDPAAYYFRTVPEFVAPAGDYAWLNESVFVGTGARSRDAIRLWVWRIT